MKNLILTILILIYCGYISAQEDFDWETDFEKSGYVSTSNYNQTREFFIQFDEYSDYVNLISDKTSPQKRELTYLVISADKNVRPTGRKKALVLIINGIHSGEIEGKDASMLLLRDILITKEREYLLDKIDLVVVPIFNVDGHERSSKFNRINQNGPKEMGWRTTSQNLNLNRDWMKADTPEMRWMLKLVNKYQPDFIFDTHTTDGADYQYSITYSVECSKNIFHSTGIWLKNEFVPYLEMEVEKKGHLVHPYVFLRNWRKGLDGGLIYWPATPRFSTGYFALRNRPSLLIETHMIKPYKERVYATKAMIEATLEFIYINSSSLVKLNREADEHSIGLYNSRSGYLPLAYSRTDKYNLLDFKGYEYHWEPSEISGGEKLVYTGKKKEFSVKYYDDIIITDSVKIPKGYLIPIEWEKFSDRMKSQHQIKTELYKAGTTVSVEKYSFHNVKFDSLPYEGRQRVAFDIGIIEQDLTLKTDMIYIPSEQQSVRVIVNLLEPQSGDSYVRWGFMNQIFERKEYYEDYVMEKYAEEMLAGDPELKTEFEVKLKTDESFRNNPQARLDFFYSRSPFSDKEKNVYPILRVVE